tara:strand:- start:726 stop:1022 length:297 start_codon:yes stop_codon:yes gene_type:complete
MPHTVIQFEQNKKVCLDQDLQDFDLLLTEAKPASFEKFHLLSLLTTILESGDADEHCKTKVIQLLIKHSDTLKSMLRYGSKQISQILYEAEAKVRNIK